MAASATKSIKTFKYLSIGLFMISLALPYFDTENGRGEPGEGAAILLSSFFDFSSSSFNLIWLANPAIWVSWGWAVKKPKRSLIASVVAVFIGSLFLFFKFTAVNGKGDIRSSIISFQIGYWLWLASTLVMLAVHLYLMLRERGSQLSVEEKQF